MTVEVAGGAFRSSGNTGGNMNGYSSTPGIHARAARIVCATIMVLGLVTSRRADAAPQPSPHPGWTHVPGAFVRPDCVHVVPNGALIKLNGDVSLKGQVIAHYDKCSEAPVLDTAGDPGSSGYVEDVQYNPADGDSVTDNTGTWYVPGVPLSGNMGQTIYLWNGVQAPSVNSIEQSVLEFGVLGPMYLLNDDGGETYEPGLNLGSNWAISNWLLSGSGAWSSPICYNSAVNDEIFGEQYIEGGYDSENIWEEYIIDETNGCWSSVLVEVSNNIPWSIANLAAMEGYNVSTCDNFPDGYWTGGGYGTSFTSNYFATQNEGNYVPDWASVPFSFTTPGCTFSVSGSGTTWGLNLYQ
jgi:hypothetical protein